VNLQSRDRNSTPERRGKKSKSLGLGSQSNQSWSWSWCEWIVSKKEREDPSELLSMPGKLCRSVGQAVEVGFIDATAPLEDEGEGGEEEGEESEEEEEAYGEGGGGGGGCGGAWPERRVDPRHWKKRGAK
jgi:hypothetical protein